MAAPSPLLSGKEALRIAQGTTLHRGLSPGNTLPSPLSTPCRSTTHKPHQRRPHVPASASASASGKAASASSSSSRSRRQRVPSSGPRARPTALAQAVELLGPADELQGAEKLDGNECEGRAWAVVRELEAAGASGVGQGDSLADAPAARDSRALLSQLVQWGKEMPSQAEGSRKLRVRENRLMGCTAQVWADVDVLPATSALPGEAVQLSMDSDASITRGLCAVLHRIVGGAGAEHVLALPPDSPALLALTQLLGPAIGGPQRANGLPSMLLSIQRRLRQRLADVGSPMAEVALESLPSILISSEGSISAQGGFAVAQAQFLNPDPASVDRLVEELQRKKIGVVAHFYMDPEVQGVLVDAQQQWPHIAISDSLVMADKALRMVAEGGCEAIAVLGVDFMAENVRAVLQKGGRGPVPVLRMSAQQIGCSLADAARSAAYVEYLEEASRTPKSLHVIYINTALDTKAVAHHFLPTITCTSSNVLQTVLQAFAEVPDGTVWFGPDTYMGGNLVDMLGRLSELPDEDIRALHPRHTAASLKALLPRVRYFQEGACIVHDMFGSEVVHQLRTAYADAYHTAHFEVPGGMFALAMEARARGRGTVGSTQNILDFIVARVREALGRGFEERLQFVLGTESGMVTAIVTAVRKELAAAHAAGNTTNVEVEIVFPVNSAAVTDTRGTPGGGAGAETASAAAVAASLEGALRVVPGAAGGEGCSIEGGCASCPYMKMNSLDALMRVSRMVGAPDAAQALAGYEPDKFAEAELMAAGRAVATFGEKSVHPSVADLGYQPILNMRHFQKEGAFSPELVLDIETRWQKRNA